MKCTVIQRFRDKESDEVFGIGATYENPNNKRVAELKRNGFIAVDHSQEQNQKEDSLLDGNVQDVISALTKELERDKLTGLLKEESRGSDRKTVKQHIEALLAEE
jgi:hypothetical protein